jgi:hypothetical protein
MQANDAKSFIELAQHIEQTLKASKVFYSVASTAHPEGTATLLSMELKEVRFLKHGTSGVYMLFEAVFNSANNTVLARRDLPLLGQLGVYDLDLGSSTARDENGNTSRTITCQVARPLLTGGLSDEVEKLCGNKASKASAAAVKAVRATDDYKVEAAVLKGVEAEIAKLQRRQERLQAGLVAKEVAAQQKALPITGKAKGKLPYQVVIA